MGGFGDSSIPPGGNHLEKPSTDDQGEVAAATSAQQKTASTLHGKHDGGVADQGSYLRLRPNPERLFTGLLLAKHQPAPEQVMQLAVQRAAQAARKAVAP